MAIYNQRIEINKKQLVNSYQKRDSIADYIYGIIRFLIIIVQNIYCVSSYLVLSWALLFPISWVRSDLYSRIENYLYNSLSFIVSSWSLAAGATIVETGDEFKHLIEDPDNFLNNISKNNGSNLSNKQNANGHRSVSSSGDKLTSQLSEDIKPKANSSKIDSASKSILQTSDTNSSLTIGANHTGDQTDLTKKNDNNLVSNSTCPKANNNNDKDFDLKSKRKATETTTTNFNLTHQLSLGLKSEQAKPRVLLLCNHISTADVPLMMQSFSTLTKQSILWVLDAQFKFTNFGLVCISHGDFFIDRSSFFDGSLRDQVLKHPDRNLLVLFPEGGFLRKRLEGSNRYALKNGLPLTKYVTHPRFGAFKDLIDPSVNVTHIVDATLLYDDIRNPLSILDIALGNRKEPAILHYKVYNRSEINPSEEWLRNIWLEKDKLLKKYYEDRDSAFERFEGSMRSLKLDWFKVLAVHIFYLLVCYLTIYRLFNATSVTMLKARDLYYSNI